MLYTVWLVLIMIIPGHEPDVTKYEMATIDACIVEQKALLERAAKPDFAEKTGAVLLATQCSLKFKNAQPGQDS